MSGVRVFDLRMCYVFLCVLKLSLLGPNLIEFQNMPKAHELSGMCSYLSLISFGKSKGLH
jgi:hypothetical protein